MTFYEPSVLMLALDGDGDELVRLLSSMHLLSFALQELGE